MSYKSARLAALFPDVYSAADRGSVLGALLDAIGAELTAADESVKVLLRSHWVRYASHDGLDGLAASYGLVRRTLRSGALEDDEALRRRLQERVVEYTGGGTVAAVEGSVRSALGLPFDLDDLPLPDGFEALRRDLQSLVRVVEFSPGGDVVIERSTGASTDGWTEVTLTVASTDIREAMPTIEGSFGTGARSLSVELVGPNATGFRSLPGFSVGACRSILFSATPDGALSALVGGLESRTQFVALDGTSPARMPAVPTTASEWRFRARAGTFDASTFDGNDSFDVAVFQVSLSRVRLQRLTFDVIVPYFVKETVEALAAAHRYTGPTFVYEGIPLEHIQEVVDAARAAGVRGNAQFSLPFLEHHDVIETPRALLAGRFADDAGAADALAVTNANQADERHDAEERFSIAGIFDFARFDDTFGFV